MSIILKGLGGNQLILAGLGESSGSPYDYIAQGGCVCGGEAECEIHQAPVMGRIVSFSMPPLHPKPRKRPLPQTIAYEAEGGCVCGGEAEAAIWTDDDIVLLLMSAVLEDEFAF